MQHLTSEYRRDITGDDIIQLSATGKRPFNASTRCEELFPCVGGVNYIIKSIHVSQRCTIIGKVDAE